MYKHGRIHGWWAVAAIACFVVVTTLLVQLAIRSSQDKLTISFLDVGQGDATLIETPSGTDILVDGGRGKKVNRPLSEVLPFYDRTLDLVIATHADSDHIGGLEDVFADYQVANAVLPARAGDSHVWSAFEKASEQERLSGAKLQRLSAGQVTRIGAMTYLITLAPPAEAVPADSNDSSYVFKLVYGDTSVLLPGDISESLEMYLADKYGEFLDADILKLAHHGSDTSSSWPFVSAVSPQFATVSAGADNSYGHPSPSVLDRLKEINASTTCTCNIGTITFVSDGRKFERNK